MLKINGNFWLEKDGQNYLGRGRVELLKQIEIHGSLNKAAKEMNMSYKAAWERVNSMNALASYPLVERTTGGKGGGGTVLTPYAHEQIALYERFDELHREFMDRFGAAGDDPEKLAGIMSRSFLSTSARNQIPCKVKAIEIEEPKCTLTLSMDFQTELKATITKKSMMDMGIEIGSLVYAIIKSSDVKVGHLPHDRLKRSNYFYGEIVNMQSFSNDIELTLGVGKHTKLTAVVNKEDISQLGVTDRAYISIGCDNIMIGV